MSAPGKEDKPGKDYWKTGDPNLRAKVISSVGLALIIITVAVGAIRSPSPYYAPDYAPGQPSEDSLPAPSAPPRPNLSPDSPEHEANSPQPAPSPDSTDLESDNISDIREMPEILAPLSIAIAILFIAGIVLAIIGLVLYLRRRKKAIP